MDLPPEPFSNAPTDQNLSSDLRRLQALFIWTVGALLIIASAANLFMGRQLGLLQLQLPAQRDAAIRAAMEFQKRDEPLIRNFVTRLQEFSRKHPDFQPVLERYRSPLRPYFAPPGQAPIPQAPRQKKP